MTYKQIQSLEELSEGDIIEIEDSTQTTTGCIVNTILSDKSLMWVSKLYDQETPDKEVSSRSPMIKEKHGFDRSEKINFNDFKIYYVDDNKYKGWKYKSPDIRKV